VVCVPRLRTSLLHCSGAFDAFVRYIHSQFFVVAISWMVFFCHRWESSRTVPLSKVRQMVHCQMVVSQQFRAEMCSLRLTQMGRPKCRIESVSVIACFGHLAAGNAKGGTKCGRWFALRLLGCAQ
jgi:hypothetical protein